MSFNDHLQQKLEKDSEFRREWEEEEPGFQIRRALIRTRLTLGLTQAELAQRIGTSQPKVSRAESDGKVTPQFLARFARGLGGTALLRVDVPGAELMEVELAPQPQLRIGATVAQQPVRPTLVVPAFTRDHVTASAGEDKERDEPLIGHHFIAGALIRGFEFQNRYVLGQALGSITFRGEICGPASLEYEDDSQESEWDNARAA